MNFSISGAWDPMAELAMDESSYYDSSDSSDTFEESPFRTPKKFKKLERSLNQSDFDVSSSLMRQDSDLVYSAITEIEEHSSSPERRNFAKRGERACMKQLFPEMEDRRNPKKHRIAAELMQDSPWLGGLIGDFSRMTGQAAPDPENMVINFGHLSSPDRTGNAVRGYHLYLPDRQIGVIFNNRVYNPHTQVWCASFQLSVEHPTKFSTFFPTYIQDESHLLDLLSVATKVAQSGNRVLLRIDPQNQETFYAEAYVRNGGRYIHSVFPLMLCADWAPEAIYKISDQITITAAEALQIAKELHQGFEADEAIRFSSRRDVTIDIAPGINTEIVNGIYFRIPKQVLEA